MTDLQDFISQALKEFDLEEMPMAGDPRRPEIASRVHELYVTSINDNMPEPKVKQGHLEAGYGK